MMSARGPVPSNDNLPAMTGAEFRTPAEHRTKVATCGVDARPVLAWPTLSRLRGKPQLARALVDYAKLMAPHRAVALPDAGDAEADEASDTAELGTDCVSEMKPTLRQLIASTFRASFTVMSDRTTIRSHDTQGRRCVNHQNGVKIIRLGDLQFSEGGALKLWRTPTSNWMRPMELLRAPKGRKLSRRDPAAVRRLVSNDDVPIAEGAQFVGGVTRSRRNGTASGRGEHLATMEQDRSAARALVRNTLSADELTALDLAISDSTSEEIGAAFGHWGKSAERVGVRRTDDALKNFLKIAA